MPSPLSVAVAGLSTPLSPLAVATEGFISATFTEGGLTGPYVAVITPRDDVARVTVAELRAAASIEALGAEPAAWVTIGTITDERRRARATLVLLRAVSG